MAGSVSLALHASAREGAASLHV